MSFHWLTAPHLSAPLPACLVCTLRRPVAVTRLIVGGTIEEQVLAVQEARHALFAAAAGGGEGEGEEGAELATTVQAPVGAEAVGAEEMQRLLDAC